MTEPIARLGLVGRPSGSAWHASHCQNPFAQPLKGSRYRIHFAGRDARNRSRGGWVEIDVAKSVLEPDRSSPGPSLDLGRLGAFDDAGAMPGSLVEFRGRLLLYYTGWTLGQTVPFSFFVGLAESHDGGETFQRFSEAPVLGRNHHDPFLTGAPWVLNDGGRLRMWYVSGTEWQEAGPEQKGPVHYYTIKHATSLDGVNWETCANLCLPYEEGEYAVARPVVRAHAGGYEMLYSARKHGGTYRIYSAVSTDGLSWKRRPGSAIDVQPSDWESEMVCYGSWLDSPQGKFILYNGNAYGRDGFGVVRLG